MLLNCGVGEDSWESLGLQGDPTSPSWKRSVLGIHWKDWCWSWNSNTLATWCEELTHWKRAWCWEGLGAGGGGDNRGWDGWMASRTQWTWVWINSGSWWWTGRPGMLQFMGSQRVRHDWATELNWTDKVTKTVWCWWKNRQNKETDCRTQKYIPINIITCSLTNEESQYNGEEKVFKRIVLRWLEITDKKKKSSSQAFTFNKNHWKWITELNAKCKTLKLLEDNRRKSKWPWI